MNEPRDPCDVLAALRPDPAVDATWAATEFARITSGDPAPRRRPRRTRRQVVVPAALAGALLVGGVGTAAASGLLGDRLTGLLGSMSADPSVAAATVHRAATAPGPDGRVFSVLTWEEPAGNDHDWCTAPLFETPASAAGPAPSDFDENGGVCGPGQLPDDSLGRQSGTNSDGRHVVYMLSAGDAVRGDLRLPDGSTRPAVLVRGWLYGWFPAGSSGELTGYAADGSVVGTVPVGR